MTLDRPPSAAANISINFPPEESSSSQQSSIVRSFLGSRAHTAESDEEDLQLQFYKFCARKIQSTWRSFQARQW